MSLQTEKGKALELAELRRTLEGQVGSHAHWGEEATDIASAAAFNHDMTSTPLALVRCRGVEDLRSAIHLAHEYAVPVSVLAGGHDLSLRCIRNEGLVLDIRPLNSVSFNRDRRRVSVGGGAVTGDVLRTLPADQAIVTGTFSTVGVAGLTMGGGYGRLNSYFGLAVDGLKEATVLLADGTLVNASEDAEPDLFWALRGGGGNFGVVTSMMFETIYIPSLLTALIFLPLAKARAALLRLQELIDSEKDDTSYFSGFMTSPAGEPVFFLGPLWIGDRAQGEKLFAELAAWDGARVIQQGWSSYRELFSEEFEAIWPKGAQYRIDVQNVKKITPEVADILVEGARQFTSPTSSLVIHDFHGAAARVPGSDTAFVMRENHFMIECIAAWNKDIGEDEKHKQWSKNLSQQLSEFAEPGAYVNLLHPDEVSRVRNFYGAAGDRLRKVKARYDPQNTFSAPGSLSE